MSSNCCRELLMKFSYSISMASGHNYLRFRLSKLMISRRLFHSARTLSRPRTLPAAAQRARRKSPNVSSSSPPAVSEEKNADVAATLASHFSITRENPAATWFVDERFTDTISHQKENSASTTTDIEPLTEEILIDNQPSSRPPPDLDEYVQRLIGELKAQNVAVIDMRSKCQWTEWMVISEGVSEAHVKRMARQFYQMIKSEVKTEDESPVVQLNDGSSKQVVIEGQEAPDWKLIDLGKFIFHFFTPEARQLYNLESLWSSVGGFTAAENDSSASMDVGIENVLSSINYNNNDPAGSTTLEASTNQERQDSS